jgi:hypothetical protein
MIAFSLDKDIDPQKLMQSIIGLIEKKITSIDKAKSSVLVVSISKVSNVVECSSVQNIEA